MDKNLRNQWLGGIVAPCIALVWGVASLAFGEIVLPIRRFESLPIYQHVDVHAWPAVLIAAAVIAFGFSMHFGVFWSRFPRFERPASLAAVGAAWIAGILFAVGIVAWSIGGLADFWQ